MTDGSPQLVRDVSDTARWVAVYRARESERPDALFRDPFARRLAGELGERIAERIQGGGRHPWAWATRTWLFDHFIAQQVREGADLVVNLAAGLDARPYRMELPASLRWVEVDLPALLDWKDRVLAPEKPRCGLERVRLDLADVAKRRELFERLGSSAKKAVIVSEGLLIYLSREQVGSLADDLAAPASFRSWVIDLLSPGLLRLMQRNFGGELERAGAPFKFAPTEGPEFFAAHGWPPRDVRGMLRTAAELRRVPLLLRLLSKLPEPKPPLGRRPWGGVVLLEKR